MENDLTKALPTVELYQVLKVTVLIFYVDEKF